MEKISCEIIQDLIPSYVDEVCSIATKACVEEHLKECSSCRKQHDVYRNMEISNDEWEKKQIDGFKKINSRMKATNRFSIILISLLVVLGIYTFYSNTAFLSAFIFYLLLPICMVGLYVFSNKNPYPSTPSRVDYIISVATVLITLFATGFMLLAITQIAADKNAFFIAPEKLGPFLHGLWVISFILLLLSFIYLLRRMTHSGIYTKSLICLPITGMFLLMTYVTLLRDLTFMENFYRIFLQHTMILITIGLFGSLIFWRIRPKN